MALSERSQRKTRMGKVISDNMEKTVVVAVETLVRHPLYGRTVRRSKKYKAHDETNACRVGDKVLLMETRPISKDKHWRVAEILEKAAVINDVRGERASDPGTDNA